MLEEYSFLDPKTHQLFRDENGGVEMPLLKNLAKFQKEHPNDAYGFYTAMFGGQRGARAAYEYGQPGVVAQAEEITRRQQEFVRLGGVQGAQNQGMDNLSNQSLRAWSGLQTVLMDLASGTVPGLTAAFKGFSDNVIDPMRDFLIHHAGEPLVAGAGYAAEGAGLWAVYRIMKRLLGFGGGGAALTASATALDGSAAALTRAAVALQTGRGVPGGAVGGGGPGGLAAIPGGPKVGGIGGFRWLTTALAWLPAVVEMIDRGVGTPGYDGKPILKSFLGFPTVGSPGYQDDWRPDWIKNWSSNIAWSQLNPFHISSAGDKPWTWPGHLDGDYTSAPGYLPGLLERRRKAVMDGPLADYTSTGDSAPGLITYPGGAGPGTQKTLADHGAIQNNVQVDNHVEVAGQITVNMGQLGSLVQSFVMSQNSGPA